MSDFKYKAINSEDQIVKGKISALDIDDLADILESMGLELISGKPIHKTLSGISLSPITKRDIFNLCIHLYEMENAKIGILESLNELKKLTEKPRLKSVIEKIHQNISSGSTLSDALSKHPKVFDNLFVNLIQAGERIGNLSEIFYHLQNHLEWQMSIGNSVKRATRYPIAMLIMTLVITSFMIYFVVPSTSKLLLEQDIEIPSYSQLLIDLPNHMVNYGPYVLLFTTCILFGTYFLCKTNHKFKLWISYLQISIPITGKLTKKIDIARFCRFFAISYKNNISVLDCLKLSADTIQNSYLRTQILSTSRIIQEGANITTALSSTGVFPSLVLKMFKIGEETGNLDRSLENVNRMYDREIIESIDTVISLIKPLLLMVLGGLLGWIAIAIFGPLYGSAGGF